PPPVGRGWDVASLIRTQVPELSKGLRRGAVRFAKPLGRVNRPRGFESPPLRSEPSGADRTRPNPPAPGGSGVSRLSPAPSPSRQQPSVSARKRPQTATQT